MALTLSGDEYVCAAGETFDSVAMRLYGASERSKELFEANPDLCHLAVFFGGERLKIPYVIGVPPWEEPEISPANAPWKE